MITAKEARKTTEEVNEKAKEELDNNFDDITNIIDSYIKRQSEKGASSLVLQFDGKPVDPEDPAKEDIIHELWMSGLKGSNKISLKYKRELAKQIGSNYQSLGFKVGAELLDDNIDIIIIRW